MNVSQKKGIKNLHAQGDAELIVCQVRNIYLTRSDRLQHYDNLVWDLIEAFDAFDISIVSREFKDREDPLAVSSIYLVPHSDFFRINAHYRNGLSTKSFNQVFLTILIIGKCLMTIVM